MDLVLKIGMHIQRTFQTTTNKGADQTVQMHSLICACVIRMD